MFGYVDCYALAAHKRSGASFLYAFKGKFLQVEVVRVSSHQLVYAVLLKEQVRNAGRHLAGEDADRTYD